MAALVVGLLVQAGLRGGVRLVIEEPLLALARLDRLRVELVQSHMVILMVLQRLE